MSKLIQEMKQEHAAIVEVLERVRQAGIHSPEAGELLSGAKSGLLAHLRKEDQKLYPMLRKAAETDAGLRNTLDIFAKDMQAVSRTALGFFEKYADGSGSPTVEFARDFGQLYAELSMRIFKEESIIYKRFEQLEARTA